MFEVILSPEARVYDQADQPLARKPSRCFAQLERNPRRHNNIRASQENWQGGFAIASETGE